jgi:hypothetical protein
MGSEADVSVRKIIREVIGPDILGRGESGKDDHELKKAGERGDNKDDVNPAAEEGNSSLKSKGKDDGGVGDENSDATTGRQAISKAMCIGHGTFDPEDGRWEARRASWIQYIAFTVMVEELGNSYSLSSRSLSSRFPFLPFPFPLLS